MTWPLSVVSLSTSVAAPETVTDSVAVPTSSFRSTRWRALTATLKVSVVGGAEARRLRIHAIVADLDRQKFVIAGGIGFAVRGNAGVDVAQRDLGAGDDGARRVANGSEDGSRIELGQGADRAA